MQCSDAEDGSEASIMVVKYLKSVENRAATIYDKLRSKCTLIQETANYVEFQAILSFSSKTNLVFSVFHKKFVLQKLPAGVVISGVSCVRSQSFSLRGRLYVCHATNWKTGSFVISLRNF